MTKLLFFMEKDAVFKLEKDISSLHMVTYRRHFERLQMSSSTQFTWLKIQSEIFRLADSFRSFFCALKEPSITRDFIDFFFKNFHVFNIERIIFRDLLLYLFLFSELKMFGSSSDDIRENTSTFSDLQMWVS